MVEWQLNTFFFGKLADAFATNINVLKSGSKHKIMKVRYQRELYKDDESPDGTTYLLFSDWQHRGPK